MGIIDPARMRPFGRTVAIVVSIAMAVASVIGVGTAVASVANHHRSPAARATAATPVRPQLATRPSGPFSVCPVDQPRHYVDDFGQPRYAGGFHRHEGIDMFAPRGTPVRAPFAGRVERSSNWAGGLSVRVDGRLGFVYEAHLSAYARTGRVRAGAIVGLVGNTGDAAGGATHDHFEWHPRGGAAVDPFRALNDVCRGRPARPTIVPWLAE